MFYEVTAMRLVSHSLQDTVKVASLHLVFETSTEIFGPEEHRRRRRR